MKEVSSSRCFNGFQKVFEHESAQLKCQMRFGVYVPDRLEAGEQLGALFFLSGLTCTEENFIVKSGMQRHASAHRVVVVNPDTSPRGVVIGTAEDPNFGAAAGFYLDATEGKWAQNYRMYSYIVEELVPLALTTFSIDPDRCGIFGHSMGGLGALVLGLRNPGLFKSISALAPICHPSATANWGRKHFEQFLGGAEKGEKWAKYDPTEVAKLYIGPSRAIRIDQGSADPFLASELLPDHLLAVQNAQLVFDYHSHPQYDHGYFFVQTFIEQHFAHHAKCWAAKH